jgi:hypothetical protein
VVFVDAFHRTRVDVSRFPERFVIVEAIKESAGVAARVTHRKPVAVKHGLSEEPFSYGPNLFVNTGCFVILNQNAILVMGSGKGVRVFF